MEPQFIQLGFTVRKEMNLGKKVVISLLDQIVHRLLWIFLMLNGCDILTTETGLMLGGKEANPLAEFLINKLGHWGLYALKGIIIGITCVYWAFQYRNNPSQVQKMLTIENIIFGLVVAWNSIMILLNMLSIKIPRPGG